MGFKLSCSIERESSNMNDSVTYTVRAVNASWMGIVREEGG